MALDFLFSTDFGLLSLFTIGFILAMAIFIGLFVRRHVCEEEQQISKE